MPSKLINSSCTDHGKEYLLVELNLRKQKWLTICNYKTMIKGYLEYISKRLIPIHQSMSVFLIGDFNSEPTAEAMKSFVKKIILKTLDKSTCYKSPTNPSCVSLLHVLNWAL